MRSSQRYLLISSAMIAVMLTAFQNCSPSFTAAKGFHSGASTELLTFSSQSALNRDGLEIGGSNFVTYSVSTYPQNSSQWYQPLVLRPVIGTYHYDPERVKAELAVMRNNGQRKISLVIWIAQLAGAPAVVDHVYGHIVASDDGRLTPQQQENLKSLLGVIQQTGFDEVQMRFATQGWSDPGSWTSWNEEVYQQNWNLIWSTRTLMEGELQSSGIRRLYDLGVELAGITSGETETYVRRLWSDYSYATKFDPSDSYGFSVIPHPGRLALYLQNLDKTGQRPSSYGFDVYDSDDLSALTQLEWLATDLKETGEIRKSVIIQETLYNDAKSYQHFFKPKISLAST